MNGVDFTISSRNGSGKYSKEKLICANFMAVDRKIFRKLEIPPVTFAMPLNGHRFNNESVTFKEAYIFH